MSPVGMESKLLGTGEICKKYGYVPYRARLRKERKKCENLHNSDLDMKKYINTIFYSNIYLLTFQKLFGKQTLFIKLFIA